MVENQKKPIVLVTGGTGMVGRNLADLVSYYQTLTHQTNHTTLTLDSSTAIATLSDANQE